METTRWFRRAGPGIVALGAVALVAGAALGAPARSWQPGICTGPPGAGGAPVGAWYRIDPVLADGTWTGQRLTVGAGGEERPRQLDLAAESFASGPFHGLVLVGSDDGRASHLSLLDVAGDCRWPIVDTSDVIRRATLSPDRRSIYEHRVDRSSRADLGVWRRDPAGLHAPARVLDPLGDDERFGPTWHTTLAWDEAGAALVVQSCGEVACRVRALDIASGEVALVADPTVGALIGVGDGRLVAHGACRGLPCPIVSVPLHGGPAVVIAEAAGQAVMVAEPAGGAAVLYEADVEGHRLVRSDVTGRERTTMIVATDGRRLVAGGDRAEGAVEPVAGWAVFGPDGRLPVDDRLPAIFRHVPDGRAVPLDEVPR